MSNSQPPVLVVGATGFLGRRVVSALLAQGRPARCLVRTPAKAADLAADGVTLVSGDMLDEKAVGRAVDGAAAVIVCVHTISPQGGAGAGEGYMDVEARGLAHITAACTTFGVRRVLYVTSIGVAEQAASSWLRGRWLTEQALFTSGLDVTVVRPGMIVGRGGDGFGIVARAASKPFAVSVAGPRQRFRTIAVEDLARDLVDLLDVPAAYGRAFEAGSDDVLTMKEMAAVTAAALGRRPGVLLHVPAGALRRLAPLVERIARVPRGAISGFVGDGPQADMTGDPTPLRTVLGRTDRPFREAIVGQVE